MPDLKKHILKRFFNELQLPPGSEEIFDKEEFSNIAPKIETIRASGGFKFRDLPKGYNVQLIMDTGKLITGFPLNYKGEARVIPEPDPVLVYFHTAYTYLKPIEEAKIKALENSSIMVMNEGVINELYAFFGVASSFVIMLHTALEAFVNRYIPKDFIYTIPKEQRTESYNKAQIQWFDIETKINKVLPVIKGQNFSEKNQSAYQRILNLKEFRNSIAHTRESDEGNTPFDYIYKKAFTYNFVAALNAVKEFCNFYHKDDYIVECPCVANW